MRLIWDIFRQYWTHALALAVFACAALRYWQLGDYFEFDHLQWIVFAFAGLVAVLAGNEFTAWTSDDWGENVVTSRNWLQQRSYTFRSWLVPVFGGCMLVWATIALYRL